jgi:4-alpha-glucanotransferase
MSGGELDRLCRHYGIETSYEDPQAGPDGARCPVPEETKRLILKGLGVDPEALSADARSDALAGSPAPRTLAAPEGVTCHCPDWLLEQPAWGMFCQLYELRSDRNWGIGDFRDLADMARIAARAGADFLGINPVHALFLGDPTLCSPFSPSSRRFLNPVYIAVDDVPGAPSPEAAELTALRATDAVDYAAVIHTKLAALRHAFDRQPFATGVHGQDRYDSYVAAGGTALRRHALFEALSLHQAAQGLGAGWHGWPADLQDAQSDAVEQFAARNEDEVAFHLWLQWIAAVQLDAARDAALDAGMRIGLYLDLAVGEAPDGSATWGAGALTLPGLTIGAPPDMFATEGQSWGLSAPSPRVLAAHDFAPFRDMISTQLTHAGALRIDHAMALWQLFLIPNGMSPAAGAHLRYPFADFVRVLAELSHHHEALVIGEDLGFVPPGFRDAMAAARILSYRILYFEQDAEGFIIPPDYPHIALACLSTHDLPTLAGWWMSEDIALREEHGLVDPQSSAEQAEHRKEERARLLRALGEAGVLQPDTDAPSAAQPDLTEAVLVAAHRYIARTPCLLAGVRLADLVGPYAPTNLPGTVDAYPNWRLRAPVAIDAIADQPAFRAVTRAMALERPRR